MTHTPPNKEPQEDVRSFAGRLLAFADAVILHGTNWVRDWDYAIRHREYLDELEESGQLDALLEVTGATREQLRASELSPLAAFELLHRMMRKLDIDPAETSAPAMAEAQWRCRLCPSWRE